MCTVHNIKKTADFAKRKGKSLREILNMITVGGTKSETKVGTLAKIENILY
jgi:transposase